jgi:hypothetical protein
MAGPSLLLLAAGAAGAASWGGIVPGETTRRQVEAQYGRPTRERQMVEEGRTVPEWTYDGDRAPKGLERMVVSFGFIRPQGFTPEVVRAITLYPNPRVFSVQAITNGWGVPDGVGTEEATGRPALRYGAQGLVVVLDRTGAWAEMLLFAPAPPKTP